MVVNCFHTRSLGFVETSFRGISTRLYGVTAQNTVICGFIFFNFATDECSEMTAGWKFHERWLQQIINCYGEL